MITTAGGLMITAGLTYPNQPSRPEGRKGTLVAYCWFKLDDGAGFVLHIKSARLKLDDFGHFFLSLPAEARQAKCPTCSRQNADHVNYCNWCGGPLAPADRKGWFMDTVCPSNAETRAALLSAAVEEHNRVRVTPEPLAKL